MTGNILSTVHRGWLTSFGGQHCNFTWITASPKKKKNKSCVPRPESNNCPFRYKGQFNNKYRRFCMLAGCFQQMMEWCSERCFFLYKDSRRKMTWHERQWEPSRDASIYCGSNYSNPALLLATCGWGQNMVYHGRALQNGSQRRLRQNMPCRNWRSHRVKSRNDQRLYTSSNHSSCLRNCCV